MYRFKHDSASTLSWQFIINSSVEFAVCKVWNFSPACHQKHRVRGIFMSSKALTKATGCARMWKVHVCHSKCMVFSVSVLSHALVTLNFKYGKLLHARNWLKQVLWQLIACKMAELFLFFLHANSTWSHYRSQATPTVTYTCTQTNTTHKQQYMHFNHIKHWSHKYTYSQTCTPQTIQTRSPFLDLHMSRDDSHQQTNIYQYIPHNEKKKCPTSKESQWMISSWPGSVWAELQFQSQLTSPPHYQWEGCWHPGRGLHAHFEH